jgi:hypothetical protein
LTGGYREWLRRGDDLGLRRPAHAAEIDHAKRGPVEIDEGLVEGLRRRRAIQRLGARKAGDRRVARLQNGRRILRVCDRNLDKQKEYERQ